MSWKEIIMRNLTHVAFVSLLLVLVPAATFGQQSSMTGVVRDTSGAVLPGVAVEASSPALIEKVRTATTDETGQFRIIELRPGIYTLTFTMTGFTTVRREGLELPGEFVMTVNAEMRVGGLEESLTVTWGADRRRPERTPATYAGQHVDRSTSDGAGVRRRHGADAIDDPERRRQ